VKVSGIPVEPARRPAFRPGLDRIGFAEALEKVEPLEDDLDGGSGMAARGVCPWAKAF